MMYQNVQLASNPQEKSWWRSQVMKSGDLPGFGWMPTIDPSKAAWIHLQQTAGTISSFEPQEKLVGWKTIKEGSEVIGQQRIRVPVFEPAAWWKIRKNRASCPIQGHRWNAIPLFSWEAETACSTATRFELVNREGKVTWFRWEMHTNDDQCPFLCSDLDPSLPTLAERSRCQFFPPVLSALVQEKDTLQTCDESSSGHHAEQAFHASGQGNPSVCHKVFLNSGWVAMSFLPKTLTYLKFWRNLFGLQVEVKSWAVQRLAMAST